MNTFKRLMTAMLIASAGFSATQANADVSYNIGYASEYYFRGILQKESSGSAGIDFEQGGLYLGSWAADVGDGLEVDLYGGYGIETESGFSASVGFTGYYYTGDFDDTYEEINLGLGYGMVSVGYSIGEWDGFGNPADYSFLEATVETEVGIYAKYGSFGKDADGDYIELGYGTTISDIDLGVFFVFSDELGDQADGESQALVFTVGKSF